MTTSHTPSDLIDLVLDGEATPDERRTLFSALGRDADLKNEFDDAVRLRSAIAREAQATVPPVALGAAIFAAAAAIETPRAAAAAPAVVGTSAATSLLGVTAQRVLAIAAAAVIVAETTYILSHRNASFVADAPRPAQSASSPASTGTGSLPNVHSGDVGNLRPHHHSLMPAAYRVVRETVPPVAFPPDADDATQQISPVTMPVAASPITPMAIDMKRERASAVDDARTVGLFADDAAPETESVLSKCSAELHGVSMIAPPANKDLDDPDHRVFNNMVLNIGCAISHDATICVAIGRETFPVEIVRADGKHSDRPSMIWGGASYRWSPASLAIANTVRPFGMGTAGGGEFGPLMRAELGAEWQPDARTSFALGVESVGIAYRNSQLWHGAGKVSVVYGVALRF